MHRSARNTVPGPSVPAPVVAQALATLGRQPSALAGFRNRLSGFVMTRLLPRQAAVKTISKAMRAMYMEQR
jgi:hypothetical protein